MAYFELAEKLGMPVSELLQRMDSHELTGWFALARTRADAEQAKMTVYEFLELRRGIDRERRGD